MVKIIKNEHGKIDWWFKGLYLDMNIYIISATRLTFVTWLQGLIQLNIMCIQEFGAN
jgi:hypothetical protein